MTMHHLDKNRGVTLFEVIILITAFGALVRLAVPNFYEFRQRASDASAFTVYEDLKEVFTSQTELNTQMPTALIFNQKGPGALPSPFSKIKLSENIRVNYLISLHYPGSFDVSALEVSHDDGAHFYRMIWVNNKRIEQVISK